MKQILIVISVTLLLVCITLLGIVFSSQTTKKQDVLKYDIHSTRLLKTKNAVWISEISCDEGRKSPCTFSLDIISHECEMVLSGDTSVTYPMHSNTQAAIVSKIDAIQSNEELSENFKRLIAEHLGIKIGKIFAGGGTTITIGPIEFDDERYIAQCVVGVAATIEEYEVVYSSNENDNDISQDNGKGKKVTVSIYKFPAPSVKVEFLPKDNLSDFLANNER